MLALGGRMIVPPQFGQRSFNTAILITYYNEV